MTDSFHDLKWNGPSGIEPGSLLHLKLFGPQDLEPLVEAYIARNGSTYKRPRRDSRGYIKDEPDSSPWSSGRGLHSQFRIAPEPLNDTRIDESGSDEGDDLQSDISDE